MRPEPMNAEQVRAIIAQMERETKSRTARKRMAELAVEHANVTSAGREVWTSYRDGFK